jgi:hypothetical protein
MARPPPDGPKLAPLFREGRFDYLSIRVRIAKNSRGLCQEIVSTKVVAKQLLSHARIRPRQILQTSIGTAWGPLLSWTAWRSTHQGLGR